MSTSNLLDVVTHYQRSIERHKDDKSRLLHCITKLYNLPIKVEHLQETGIGKTINSLRKQNGEVSVAAEALVTKWKQMVSSDEIKPKLPNSSDDDQDENKHHNTSSGEEHQINNDHLQDKSNHTSSSKIEHKSSKHKSSSSSSSSRHKDVKKEHKSSRDKSKDNNNHSHKNSHNSVKDEKPQRKEEKKSEERQHKDRDSTSKGGGSSSISSTKRNHEGSKEKKHKSNDQDVVQKEHVPDDVKEKKSDKDKHYKSSKDKSHKSKEDKHKSSSDKHKSHTKSSSSSTSKKSSEFTSNSSSEKRKRNEDDETSPKTKVSKIQLKSSHDIQSSNESSNDANEATEGFDSSMGANFEDVLGMLNMPMPGSSKKAKKTQNKIKDVAGSSKKTSAISLSNSLVIKKPEKSTSSLAVNGLRKEINSTRKPDLLSSAAKLEPLDPNIALELPTSTISTNYKPMPLNQTVMDVVFNSGNGPSTSTASKYTPRTFDESEALAHGISSKTMRTKIYSGARTGQIFQVPSLFDLCIRVLQKNIDALEYTGGVPYDVLRPVLERATPQQLLTFEDYNPYLMEDSDALWQMHVQRNYRTQRRQEMESWREMYIRCQEEKERKLSILAKSIKQQQKINEAPVRKTQLAFVDSVVKPPRGIQRRQDQFGTRAKPIATPAARVAALSSVIPNAAKAGDARLRVMAGTRDTAQIAVAPSRPKKAPLMAKALQFIRGRQKR